MRRHLDLGSHDAGRHLIVLVLDRADRAAAVIGEAEILAHLRGAIEFARRLVVTHAVDLVVGEPQGLVGRIEVNAHRIADAGCIDLSVLAVLIHADDAADADALEQLQLLLRRHVEGLTESDVELVVRSDAADAGRVVEALLRRRDQLALFHDDTSRHIGTFIEELRRRELQHPVLLGDIEHAVAGEADSVRILNSTEGANCFTSSATRSLSRSVTT